MRLSVVGIGPGSTDYLLPAAREALATADVAIAYHYYFRFIADILPPTCTCIGKDLAEEEQRARLAVDSCAPGRHVVVISSGDAGIYAMASLVYEYAARQGGTFGPGSSDRQEGGDGMASLRLQTIPGISAFQAAAARLGAPIGHDFCCISLSDLMTPWQTIEKRILGAAVGDFVTCIYNPRSRRRNWQLGRLKEIFLSHRAGSIPVAIVRQVTRPDESILLTTLDELDIEDVDMFCLVLIGNTQTYRFGDFLVTPRGYLGRKPHTGQEIQDASFREIRALLTRTDLSPADQWAVTRCIHSTADTEYEQLYYSNGHPLEKWQSWLAEGGVVVTDVTMVQSGITKEFLRRDGVTVKCYLNEDAAVTMAAAENITRSQAGMRLAIREHPDALFVIGNAPTALLELCDQYQQGTCRPAGVIAAPVGFVNVVESKLRLKYLKDIPSVIIGGRKGGSNVAASIVNAVFTLNQATIWK